MNDIKLKNIVFSNFMAYGNNVNEFSFPDGMIWMSADNGSGKSTLVEVIGFAFFGTSYRGGNRGELRNTRNVEGTLRVMMEFDRTNSDGTETFRVTRTVSPKGAMKFEVEKMEGEDWVVQSKRAGYSQKDFEENVLGFNEILFKNDIAMNTQESIPFIDMAAKQRRDLLESIVSVSVEPIKKETARRLSAACSACDVADADIRRISGEITNLEGICERLKQEKQANIDQLTAQYDEKVAARPAIVEAYNGIATKVNEKAAEVNRLSAECGKESEVDAAISRIQAAGTEVSMLAKYNSDLKLAQARLTEVTGEYSKFGHDALKAAVVTATDKSNSISTEIRKVEMEKYQKECQVGTLTSQQAEVERQGKSLKPGVPCPTCGKLSTEEDIEPHRKELRRKWAEYRDQIAGVNGEIAVISARIDTLKTSLDEAEQAKAEAVANEQRADSYYKENVIPAATTVNALNSDIARSRSVISAAKVDADQFATELTRLSGEKAKFPALRQQWQDAQGEYNSLMQECTTKGGELNSLDAEINRLGAEIEKAKQKAADDSLALTEEKLTGAREDLADAEKRLHMASDDKAAYEYIGKNLCADDGMKKMVFGIFVPAFNASVQKNIYRLNLPFTVEFDDSMAFTFHSEPGLAPSYEMLSQGQRRKLGFAISMAFRDFVSLVGNFRINFLSLDEVLDISTDDNAMGEMLDIVKDMVDEIGCALIITHRGQAVADKFDYKLTVENDGIYSTLGELQKL